jgi:hypothetical protein
VLRLFGRLPDTEEEGRMSQTHRKKDLCFGISEDLKGKVPRLERESLILGEENHRLD